MLALLVPGVGMGGGGLAGGSRGVTGSAVAGDRTNTAAAVASTRSDVAAAGAGGGR